MAKKKARRKRIVIDRKLGVKIGRKTYYPLPENKEFVQAAHNADAFPEISAAVHLGPCTGRANGESCGSNCICWDHQPRYSVDGLRALGFTLSKLDG